MIHHTKCSIILDSKLCLLSSPSTQDEGEGDTTWPYCHRQPYCRMESGCQACIVTPQNYLRGCDNLLRQKDNSSDLAKLWEQGWRESTVGSLNPTLGLKIAFLVRSIGLYLSPYVVDSLQTKWNEDVSQPFTWKRRRGCFSVHQGKRSSDMIWVSNRKNDNGYCCLSSMISWFNPGTTLCSKIY